MTDFKENSELQNPSNERSLSGIAPAIRNSWARCSGYGLKAYREPEEPVLSDINFRDILQRNETIRKIVTPELELLYEQIAGTNFMVAYADNNGVVLDSIQDHNFSAGEGGKTVIPGSVWTESQRGTNALGLVVQTQMPAIVTGRDHFFHKLNDLSCFAAPFFDHEENLLGVIDATSNTKARNEHTLALVKLASRNIENRLFAEQFKSSTLLVFHARQEYMMTTSAAMIAVDEYGFIQGATANAKLVLNGLDLVPVKHLGEVFETNFFDLIDNLRLHGVVSIRDRMGSAVFMKAQAPIIQKDLKSKTSGSFKERYKIIEEGRSEQNFAPQASKAKFNKDNLIFEDEVLIKEILSSARAVSIGLPITILGERSSGKMALAKEVHHRAFGNIKLSIIDCSLLNYENFELYLYGKMGKVAFFESDPPVSREGKFGQARGGTILLKNAHMLDLKIKDDIASTIQYEQSQPNHIPSIKGWFLSGPLNWMENEEFASSVKFASAINGRSFTAPNLTNRSDFRKIVLSVLARCSKIHHMSPTAMKILEQESWPGNFMQLDKAIRHAVSQSKGDVIREEIKEYLKGPLDEGLKPCSKCLGSPIKEKTCITIQRSWKETGGKVSLVARRLGISRNTVYKHIINR